MKIKRENYKTVDLFSYCKDMKLNEKDTKYLLSFISEKSLNQKIKIINRLKKEPLQYVLNTTNFYGYDYYVNKNVLIPRFETEELVENTIKIIKERFNCGAKLLDLGTGSGCIGITIKKIIPSIDVTLSDISNKALIVARKNIKDLDINIIQGNLLKPFIKNQIKFNIIISNPPYISIKDSIDEKVKNNEPHIALYAKDNGTYYYEEILKDINKVLEKEFLIAFEIGMNQKKEINILINKYLSNVKITFKKDLQGRDRMVFIQNLTKKEKDV